MFKNIVLIGIGGATGSILRYGMTLLFASMHLSGNTATFITNLAGSFCMGLLVSTCEQSPWLMMATIGLCGGFTTFSTFSMQSLTFLQEGKYGAALMYILGTVILGIALAAAGWYLGHLVIRKI